MKGRKEDKGTQEVSGSREARQRGDHKLKSLQNKTNLKSLQNE